MTPPQPTPSVSPARLGRPRLGLGAELVLVALPTLTVLLVFALVEALTRQRLLFASLASSAFLIYLDPEHSANQVTTLVIAQIGGAVIGFGALALLGPGYAAAATAMVVTILTLVLLGRVHPPAIATTLAFAFQDTKQSNVVLFALAVGMIAMLVALERACVWLLRRAQRPRGAG